MVQGPGHTSPLHLDTCSLPSPPVQVCHYPQMLGGRCQQATLLQHAGQQCGQPDEDTRSWICVTPVVTWLACDSTLCACVSIYTFHLFFVCASQLCLSQQSVSVICSFHMLRTCVANMTLHLSRATVNPACMLRDGAITTYVHHVSIWSLCYWNLSCLLTQQITHCFHWLMTNNYERPIIIINVLVRI